MAKNNIHQNARKAAIAKNQAEAKVAALTSQADSIRESITKAEEEVDNSEIALQELSPDATEEAKAETQARYETAVTNRDALQIQLETVEDEIAESQEA